MQNINISQISSSFPTGNLFLLIILGSIPLIFFASTSYIKISVILSVLRSALGGGQIPSQSLSGMLAFLITLYTIFPALEVVLTRLENTNFNTKSIQTSEIIEKIKYVCDPLVSFVRLNVQRKERLYFYNLEQKRKNDVGVNNDLIHCNKDTNLEIDQCLTNEESVQSLILSFVIGELRIACTLGVYLFIPFLLVDLIVSTILTGLGMMMVSPVTITLPLKLFIFVVSDGWRLLVENLILGYKFI